MGLNPHPCAHPYMQLPFIQRRYLSTLFPMQIQGVFTQRSYFSFIKHAFSKKFTATSNLLIEENIYWKFIKMTLSSHLLIKLDKHFDVSFANVTISYWEKLDLCSSYLGLLFFYVRVNFLMNIRTCLNSRVAALI